jgi:hypothetical protein
MQAAGTEEDPVDLVLVSDDSSDEVPPPPAAPAPATKPRKRVLPSELHGGRAAKRQHSRGTGAAAAGAALLEVEAPEAAAAAAVPAAAEPAAAPAPAADNTSPRLVEVAKMLKRFYADSLHVVHAMAPFQFLAEQLYGDDAAWGEVRLAALVSQLPSLPERVRGSASSRLV